MTDYVAFLTDQNLKYGNKEPYGAPSPYFRKKFLAAKSVKRALIKAAAYGIFELYFNGEKVSDEVFATGWSDTHYTVYYRDYDVTDKMRSGVNVLGAILGDGWYASNLSDCGRFVFGDYPLKFYYRIELTYCDGTREIIKIDGMEKATTGEIIASDNQNGEIIDKRQTLGNFSSPSYDDSAWKSVSVYKGLRPRKANFPPIIGHQPIRPVNKSEYDDKILYDFGQNFAGVLRVKAKGDCGDKIIAKHAEILVNGRIFTANLRSAIATDTFILSGKEDVFFPMFTFHGFRYAELQLIGDIEISEIEAVPLYTDLKPTAEFRCSDETVNKIYSNIVWGQKSTFFSVPEDCPQRDERLGWTGDALLFHDVANWNFDCKSFFEKFMNDAEDSLKDGKADIPVVLPYLFDYVPYDMLHINYTGYSECVITIPYKQYLTYGDKSILVRCFPMMEKHIEYMLTVCDDYIPVRCNTHSDWLSLYEDTDRDVFSTLFFAYSVYLMRRICAILNKEVLFYDELFNCIVRSFKEKFIDGQGVIKGDTQCSYILAYAFNVLKAEEVKDNLIRKFRQFNGALVTGFFGTKFALETLCELGLKELAYDLLTKTEYPSWGYAVKMGATTLWERWDSMTEDSDFNKYRMNSFNHPVFGSFGYWFFEGMFGIKPTEEGAGFKKIRVRPYLSEKIKSGETSYATKYGKIKAKYEFKGGAIVYELTLPKGITPIFDFNDKIVSEKRENHKGKTRFIFVLENDDEGDKL